MLHVACCLWDSNDASLPASRCYDESWVEKLYGGFKRNLTRPFHFVLFTDRLRELSPGIEQEILETTDPNYGCLIEPFKLNEPTIIAGLDTIIVRNIDHFADYCLEAERLALPRNPYDLAISINAVALVPKGHRHIFDGWGGENDMDWLRTKPCAFIDDMWPGQVRSLKAHKLREVGLDGVRIVYFHGNPRPPELMHLGWVKDNWRA